MDSSAAEWRVMRNQEVIMSDSAGFDPSLMPEFIGYSDESKRKGPGANRIEAEDAYRISGHNLLTPLNSMISLSQLLLHESNLTLEQRAMIKMITNSGLRVRDMIHLSLCICMMENGNYALTPVAVDLIRILQNIRTEMHSLLKAKNVSLEMEKDGWPMIWDDHFMVMGEKLLCYSVLVNLIRNAIEASPCGTEVIVLLASANGQTIVIRNKGEVPVDFRDDFFKKYATLGKRAAPASGHTRRG